MGFYAASDCELGLTLSHGGGYPGYGSHVLLLSDYGVGIFALANRTYAGPRAPVWDAAVTLARAGRLKSRSSTPSGALSAAYAAATKMFNTGSVTSAGDVLAMNFLIDRDAEHRARDYAALKADVGACDTTAPIAPTGALSGEFTWRCENGRVRVSNAHSRVPGNEQFRQRPFELVGFALQCAVRAGDAGWWQNKHRPFPKGKPPKDLISRATNIVRPKVADQE